MNNSLKQRVLGLEGAAVSSGDPSTLWQWTRLLEQTEAGDLQTGIEAFERRLKTLPKRNNLDKHLPRERRRLVLDQPATRARAADSDLRYFEREVRKTLGFYTEKRRT